MKNHPEAFVTEATLTRHPNGGYTITQMVPQHLIPPVIGAYGDLPDALTALRHVFTPERMTSEAHGCCAERASTAQSGAQGNDINLTPEDIARIERFALAFDEGVEDETPALDAAVEHITNLLHQLATPAHPDNQHNRDMQIRSALRFLAFGCEPPQPAD